MITKLPLYYIARRFNRTPPLPMNYTFSLTYNCNSKCKTCNITQREPVEELTPLEWRHIFKSLGKSPYWVTFSGGEPFLKKDIWIIYSYLCQICRPAIVNIPTNGLLTSLIVKSVEQMLKGNPKVQLIVNVSIDHLGEKNDEIRGVKGAYTKSVETFFELQKLSKEYKNLTVGIHTVISSFNVEDFPIICDFLIGLNPTSYVAEIAECREELLTLYSKEISPNLQKYKVATEYLTERMIYKRDYIDVSRIIKAFRRIYYKLTIETLKRRTQVTPCYAGWASVQIAPNGDVWPCCILADSIGNLRDYAYNLKPMWCSPLVTFKRFQIKAKQCYCPMANVSYTNMIFSLKILPRLMRYMFIPRRPDDLTLAEHKLQALKLLKEGPK